MCGDKITRSAKNRLSQRFYGSEIAAEAASHIWMGIQEWSIASPRNQSTIGYWLSLLQKPFGGQTRPSSLACCPRVSPLQHHVQNK